MKFNRISIMMAIILMSSIAFISCKDDKKEVEEARIEAEKIEAENAKKLEEEKIALQAKEEAIKKEARDKSIGGMTMKNNDLSTLYTALQTTELTEMLSQPGEYTIFAPSNQAFNKLPEKEREALMLPDNKEKLKSVLQYHVIPGKITSDRLADAIKNSKNAYVVKTATGEEVTLSMNGDQYVIKDGTGKKAQVILGNQDASNGIIYIIDTVLMAKKS